MAGPHLLAQVLVDKYADHLPLYRQQQRFKRHGMYLSRATLWNWVRLSALSLAPLVEAMKEDLFLIGHVFSDDTPMPTQRHGEAIKARTGLKKNTMWVYTGLSSQRQSPIVLYDYTCGRGAEHPACFLKNFQGYLQTDAYAGYLPLMKQQPSIIPLGCMAHARRKFVEALLAHPQSMAQEIIDKMGKLYKLERDFKERTLLPPTIAEERREQALPILQEMHQWLLTQQPLVTPKSLLGKAIRYALSQWDALIRYTQDGRLEIDNNRSERCIKRVVMGRKNYLFMGSNRGGKAAALLYSLVETCQQNDIDPLAYVADVLERIPTHLNKHIQELLPYNWKPRCKELEENLPSQPTLLAAQGP